MRSDMSTAVQIEQFLDESDILYALYKFGAVLTKLNITVLV